MKADQRHEVETNELAESLGQLGQWVQQNFALVVGSIVVLFAGLIAYSVAVSEKPKDAPADDWNRYFIAMASNSPAKDLQTVIDDAKDRRAPAIVQATLVLGELQLADGCKELFEDRAAADASFEKAKRNLDDALASAPDSFTRVRAWMALAKLHESRNEIDDAIAMYEKVLKSGGDSALAKTAAEKQRLLSAPETKQFLTWFASQKPTPRSPHGGAFPNMQNPPPEIPDFNLPELPGPGPAAPAPFLPGLTPPGAAPPEQPATPAPKTEESAGDKKVEGEPKTPEAPKTEAPQAEPESKSVEPNATEAKPAETK